MKYMLTVANIVIIPISKRKSVNQIK